MQHYFAPLEGLTDSIFRRLHHKYFPGVDRYYTPFFSPTVHRALTPKEARELPAADTLGYVCVPQLLTKSPEDFLWMAGQCKDLGYQEVNLNLGCPSGTVTAKGKGSGMLRDPDSLDAFLNSIYSTAPVDISVKCRIGFSSPEEFPRLLEIFNQYPIKELTVHPRVREAFYKGSVDMESFTYATENSRAPVCYNGDITRRKQLDALVQRYPGLGACMIGRGLIRDPGMFTPGGTTVAKLEAFYNEMLEQYMDAFGGGRNAMFRLKEHWGMLIGRFSDNDRLAKQLRKTTDVSEYKMVTAQIFHTLPFA